MLESALIVFIHERQTWEGDGIGKKAKTVSDPSGGKSARIFYVSISLILSKGKGTASVVSCISEVKKCTLVYRFNAPCIIGEFLMSHKVKE